MGVSKTGVVLFVLFFFSFLSVMIGVYEESESAVINPTGEVSRGSLGFLGSIVSGYASLPPAFNLLIFGTFAGLIAWLVYTSLPTIDGGS